MATWLFLGLLCVVGGVATVVQSQFLGVLEGRLGVLESVFITYGSGGLLVGLVMLGLRGGNLRAWQSVPFYVYLSGVAGLVIIGTLSYTVPRLGLVVAFTLFIVTQLVFGAALDHFGWLGAAVRPLTLSRALGILVLLVGVWLVIRK